MCEIKCRKSWLKNNNFLYVNDLKFKIKNPLIGEERLRKRTIIRKENISEGLGHILDRKVLVNISVI